MANPAVMYSRWPAAWVGRWDYYYEFVSPLKRPEVCSRALGPKIETAAPAGRAAGLARGIARACVCRTYGGMASVPTRIVVLKLPAR